MHQNVFKNLFAVIGSPPQVLALSSESMIIFVTRFCLCDLIETIMFIIQEGARDPPDKLVNKLCSLTELRHRKSQFVELLFKTSSLQLTTKISQYSGRKHLGQASNGKSESTVKMAELVSYTLMHTTRTPYRQYQPRRSWTSRTIPHLQCACLNHLAYDYPPSCSPKNAQTRVSILISKQ